MLISEIAMRVKRQFGDEAGAQITDADIIRWVNDAQTDIAVKNDLLQVSATTATTAGVQKYTVPTNLLILRSVRWKGVKLQPLTMEEADALTISGDTGARGTPVSFWQFARQIYVWPPPDANGTADLTLFYTRQPVVATLTSETPELPLQYHPRLVEYCIAQAAELDDNLQHFQVKMNQFEQGVENLKSNNDWENQDFYPGITVSNRDSGDGDLGYGY